MGSGGACPVAFCPGDEVTHTCDVGTLMGATEWRLPNGTCDDSIISLNQFGSCSDADGTCGPFSAANDGSDGTNCLVSSLTVTATTDLNNTLIQCSNVDLLNNPTEVGSAVFTIAGWWSTVTFFGGGRGGRREQGASVACSEIQTLASLRRNSVMVVTITKTTT